jgi:Uma2 family endonuclease
VLDEQVDAGPKRRAYARRGIPAYWIVDLARRLVEVYELAGTELKLHSVHSEHDTIAVVLDGSTHGSIPAADLFP